MNKRMTVAEVARMAGVTSNAVNAAIHRGELSAERFGERMYMVEENSAREYAARVARRKPGTAGRGLLKTLTVTLPEETLNKLLRMAEERGISRSQMVGKMILWMEKTEAMING